MSDHTLPPDSAPYPIQTSDKAPRHRRPGEPRTDELPLALIAQAQNRPPETDVIDMSTSTDTGTDTGNKTAEALELRRLAEETSNDAQTYLDAVTEVAAGSQPDTAIPVLLLALSQTLLAGARLGAIRDVVPSERFEPDAGPDADIDPVRAGLANLFDGVDEYADVIDPLTSGEVVSGALSDDLADIAADLAHGLRHYRAGRVDEALWWWQFSYLSTWGLRATSSLRVLQSMIGHLRLDVDADTASDAEFDALHTADHPS